MLDFPLNFQDKSIIEGTKFLQLKSLQFLGGLPVLTAVPTYEGTNGEVVWVKTGANPNEIYDLYGYISNNASTPVWGWRKVATSAVAPTYATIAFPNTQIYDGAMPGTDWVDLDLSSVVGAKTSLVLLKIVDNYTGGAAQMIFRQNGETSETTSYEQGVNSALFGTNNADRFCYIVCLTDTGGVIEWKALSAYESVQVWVMAYIQ
jgi:hypothetical protein